MASFRDQLNAYGKQNDPAMSRHGNYADLPNPQRAEEIVTEARQRLAASGGKASMLPQMIQRVSAEFAQRDDQNNRGSDRSPDYQQPNNIDAYIDRVLQMGGMTADPSNKAAAGDGASAGMDESDDNAASVQLPSGEDAPIPTARPDMEAEEGSDGWSFGQMAAGLLGMGGVAALGRYLYDNYGKKAGQVAGDALSDIDKSIAAVDGDEAADVDGGQRVVTETKQGRLAAPVDQIEGPRKQITDQSSNAVDDTINQTMSEEEFDQRFGGMVEGTENGVRPGPNRFSGQGNPDPNVAAAIDEATALADSGNVRGAVNRLREAGVEIDDNLMRTLAEASNTFKSLRTRAGSVAGDAVGNAARRAVR